MKKILSIVLCVLTLTAFISCSKGSTDKNETSTTENYNNIFSSSTTKTEDEKTSNTKLEYKGKSVKNIRLNSSAKMNIDIDADTLNELENAENDGTVPDVDFDMAFGTVEIIYSDETTETIGTAYIGSDKALYIKFDNNKNKDAAYKLSESIF